MLDDGNQLKRGLTRGALVNPSMGWTMHFYSNVPAHYRLGAVTLQNPAK